MIASTNLIDWAGEIGRALISKNSRAQCNQLSKISDRALCLLLHSTYNIVKGKISIPEKLKPYLC